MAQLSSLYARVRLTEGALGDFLGSPLALPSAYGDWMAWLESQQFLGQITERDLAALEHSGEPASVGAALEQLIRTRRGGPSEAAYDASAQTWTICVGQLADDYVDFIVILSALRAAAAYKDLPGEDVVLIWPFLWGGEPEAYLVIEQGASRLGAAPPDEVIAEAGRAMRALYGTFGAPPHG